MRKQSFAEILKNARKEAGKTQERVAEDVCVATSTYKKWEGGSNMPTRKNMKRIREEFEKYGIPFPTMPPTNITENNSSEKKEERKMNKIRVKIEIAPDIEAFEKAKEEGMVCLDFRDVRNPLSTHYYSPIAMCESECEVLEVADHVYYREESMVSPKIEKELLYSIFSYLYKCCTKEMQTLTTVVKLLTIGIQPEGDEEDERTLLDYVFREIEGYDKHLGPIVYYKAFRSMPKDRRNTAILSSIQNLRFFITEKCKEECGKMEKKTIPLLQKDDVSEKIVISRDNSAYAEYMMRLLKAHFVY